MFCGLETEYGLWIEGRGPHEQIEDAAEVVRSYPNPCFVGWDYQFESPRADVRGFVAAALSVDPVDAQFDAGAGKQDYVDLRSDRVLTSGARLYNDHGHPEYATSEGEIRAVVSDDLRGERAVLASAQAYASRSGRRVKVYKNNTDFHGASYGTHENFLVSRSVPVELLIGHLVPMLVVRQVLTGAGKVGAELGTPCDFQISQRADYFSELASVDTLYRRPLFNTRDEPHADRERWLRLHVITGDANRMPLCTQRKLALAFLAIDRAERGLEPTWKLKDPAAAFESVSKDSSFEFVIETEQGQTTAYEIMASYLDSSEISKECSELMGLLRSDFELFARRVDWAAKRRLIELADSPDPRSVDLAYADLDPEESLYDAMIEADEIETWQPEYASDSRGFARGIAVEHFAKDLISVNWRKLVFKQGEVELWPAARYPLELSQIPDVNQFIDALRGIPHA